MSAVPVVCLGETLWDVLPTGEFLGGAPLNVAAHLTRLGTPALLVSRVGADERGRRAFSELKALGLDTSRVQVDPWLPTGEARATLDAAGAASYAFLAPAAWDRIEADEVTLERAHRAAAVVFGTLAQRGTASAGTVGRILEGARWRVLDVNLRPPHDDREVTLASLARADFVKLNDTELVTLAGWLGVEPRPAPLLECLAARFGTTSLCVTKGAHGALLWHEGEWCEVPAPTTVVVDTVGAGDAFLAMLLAELLAGTGAPRAMARAARLAAFVASMPGAIPPYEAGTFRGD